MKVRRRLIVSFLLPASALYLAFFLIPAVWAFYFSAFDWSGFTKQMRFIGLDNYIQLAKDPIFWKSLSNTLLILLLGGLIVFLSVFTLTILINSGVRGKRFFRAVIFLPNVIAAIALVTLWQFIYNNKFGLLSGSLRLIGLTSLANIPWLGIDYVFFAMLAALIWIEVGFYLVLMLAGVDRLPLEFFEAARLEGASQLQMFVRITLPLMWDVITVALVLWTIFALKIFEFPFAFTGIEPLKQVYTLGIYLYVMGFGQRQPIYRLGYATAMGVVLLLIILLMVIILRRVARRDVVQY
jgi:ABC-type sugar transport system permease subunit